LKKPIKLEEGDHTRPATENVAIKQDSVCPDP